MDTSDLVKRYGSVPEHLQREVDEVWSRLQEQKDSVISAKALANFGVDDDMTLLYGKTHRGLIVNLKSDYVVSEKDSWIPKNLYQVRALFQKGKYTNETLEDTNCSIGTYVVSSINEIGDMDEDMYTIVDTHTRDMEHSRESWNGRKVSEVYSVVPRESSLNAAKALAVNYDVGQLVGSYFTNVLYRGQKTFHFYNNAYKEAGLVLVSPLSGYTMVDEKDHPSDLMSSELISVDQLDDEKQRKLYSKAYWDSCELINTYVMRKTFSRHPASFRMKKACFSNTPIHNMLTPEQVLKLTPVSCRHVPETMQIKPHIKDGKLEVPITSDVALKLIDLRDEPGFKLLNENFYDYDKRTLTLPRKIVAKLI